MASIFAPVTQSSAENKVVSLSANLNKAREEVAGAKAELDGLRAAAELATKQHNVAFSNIREERQD